MKYFANKEEYAQYANKHTRDVATRYARDIEFSVNNTEIISADEVIEIPPIEIEYPLCYYADADTVSAIFNSRGEDTWVLNFASYKNPGGMFMYGSSAQEESLCRESYLYNVISHERFKEYYAWNRDHLNIGLYMNRMLLSPHIVFERDNMTKSVNVITCAAPNYTYILKHVVATTEHHEYNQKMLANRIKFILLTLRGRVKENDVVILGAFGCGVFRQDPNIVANFFKDNMYILGKCHVIFAVPSGYSRKDNSTAMIFKNMVDSYEKVRTYDT